MICHSKKLFGDEAESYFHKISLKEVFEILLAFWDFRLDPCLGLTGEFVNSFFILYLTIKEKLTVVGKLVLCLV